MKPQKPTENWTKFPNCILDSISVFSPQEFQVLAFMIRKNLGYTNPNKMFSVRYIQENVGMSRPTVMNVINGLLEKESLIIIGEGAKGIRYFDINWDVPVDKDLNRSKTFTDTGKKDLPVQVKKIDQVLDTTKTKQGKKIDYSIYLDSWNSLAASISIPTIRDITGARRRHLMARIRENPNFEKSFLECLTKIQASQFLQQDSSQSWFGFNWLIKNDDNYTKVLEGRYDNRLAKQSQFEINHNKAKRKLGI